ncbi:MAG: tyrosine-protein kinase family protein [Ignavibacteriales bacterium]
MNDDDIIRDLVNTISDKSEMQKSGIQNNGGRIDRNLPVQKNFKPVIYNSRTAGLVNDKIISYQLYNCFNYSLFINNNDNKNIKYMIGVTSANPGEGKTTTACNLATALSLSSQRKTVLVDLNIDNPRIHDIFGTQISPGITDALHGKEICVTPTKIENLSILPAGNGKSISPKKFINFNSIAYSLLQEFEFLIVDMASVTARNFPTLIANQLNGLIVVVESNKTKRRDINRIFRCVSEKNVIGFVMNKVNDEDF